MTAELDQIRLAVREEMRAVLHAELPEALGNLGMDYANPQESRLDFAHLRRSRKAFGHVILTAFGGLTMGVGSALWLLVQGLFDKSS